jgi:hypothetical protein
VNLFQNGSQKTNKKEHPEWFAVLVPQGQQSERIYSMKFMEIFNAKLQPKSDCLKNCVMQPFRLRSHLTMELKNSALWQSRGKVLVSHPVILWQFVTPSLCLAAQEAEAIN